MKAFLTNHIAISIYATTFACMLISGAWYNHHTELRLINLLKEHIEVHAEIINELAVLTDGNDVDVDTANLLRDCPRRSEFETMLTGLGTASKRDLITTQQLFESCGSFYAERKALVVNRMEEEYTALAENVALLVMLEDLDQKTQTALRFSELIELEKTRSTLLSEQVLLQETIIRALISGGSVSEDITTSTTAAQEVGQSLTVLDKQIDALRAELMP